MTNAAGCVKQLIQDLAEDRQHYAALNTLLEQQREHILARHAAGLEPLNAQIMAHYQTLTQHSQRRHQLLNQLNIQPDANGIQTLIAHLPASHRQTVSTLWHDLQEQAARCQRANEYNGTLMNMQQEILAGLLNISEPENWLYQQS